MSETRYQESIENTDGKEILNMAEQNSDKKIKNRRHSKHDTENEEAEEDKEEMPSIFKGVLAQLRKENITTLASSVRQAREQKFSLEASVHSIGCKLSGPPLCGSYNLVYTIIFQDGVRWMLKIPASGHHGCHGTLEIQALRTEVHTMQAIKDRTDIPLPTVYGYDESMSNEIGCPYTLMEFIDGIPLYEAWFKDDVSESKQESIRLKALQAVAVAMVKLGQFKFAKGGAPLFGSDGERMDITHTRAADFHAMWDKSQNGDDDYRDEICFAKGPFSDPTSHLLFMLRRRGIKDSDRALDRGGQQSIDMFTKWASEYVKVDDERFTLAHPDLDTQNIFVKEDGTVCGIIDWDGVAAVPYSVGALKYPLWLMRDWEPKTYNYDIQTGRPRSYDDRVENSPDELSRYRVAYAHFIETASLSLGKDGKESRQNALITRASLVFGTLEHAASNPWVTRGNVGHIFNEMSGVMEDLGLDDASDTDPTDSEATMDSNDHGSDQDEEDGKGSSEKTEAIELDKNNVIAGDSSEDFECPRCVADKRIGLVYPQKSSEGALFSDDNSNIITDHREVRSEGSESDRIKTVLWRNQHPALSPHEPEPEPGSDPEPKPVSDTVYSKKVQVAKFLCGFGEKCCKGFASALYRKDATGACVKGRDDGELAATENLHPGRISENSGAILQVCRWAQGKLLHTSRVRRHMASLTPHPDGASQETSSKQGWFALFIKWVLRTLGKVLSKVFTKVATVVAMSENPDVRHVEVDLELLTRNEKISEAAIKSEVKPKCAQQVENIPVLFEHAENCPKAVEKKTEGAADAEGGVSSERMLSEIWDRISLEVQNAGIPANMVKENQAAIADQIIVEMRRKTKIIREQEEAEQFQKEMEAERIANEKKKARRAAMKAKKAIEAAEDAETSQNGKANGAIEEIPADLEKKRASAAVSVPGVPGVLNLEESNSKEADISEGSRTVVPAAEVSRKIEHRAIRGGSIKKLPTDKAKSISILEVAEQKAGPEGTTASVKTTAADASSEISTTLGTKADHSIIPLNKPCPCGSKHKYKKCCGRSAKPEASMTHWRDTMKSSIQKSPLADVISSTSRESLSVPPAEFAPKFKCDSRDSLEEAPEDSQGSSKNENQHSTPLLGTQEENEDVTMIDAEYEQVKSKGDGDEHPDDTGHGDTGKTTIHSRKGKAPEDDETWSLDEGGMSVNELLVALGKGRLDDKRKERLKTRFEWLLDVVIGTR